jgi:dihydrodipicolinate synthase/N-acetylneuraminate lyase
VIAKSGLERLVAWGRLIGLKRSQEKAMRLTAIKLAVALALTGTAAFAMGSGAGGASGGVGSTYTSDPARCGGLVCFAKSPLKKPRARPRRGRHA